MSSDDKIVPPTLDQVAQPKRGLAAFLKAAKNKGYIAKDDTKLPTIVQSASTKDRFTAKTVTIEDKRDESRDHRSNKGQKLRDFRNPQDYKPEISLEYRDDSGRKLDTQGAYKYMCHKFHGKGPGKNKVDKRIKKQILERKMKESLSTGAPNSSAALMISKQKELQSPFIVLSKGK